jgi:RHS repeat-associated protein
MYSYDARSRPVTVNGNTMLYDAFSRAVELQTGSSTYQQVVYSPTGQKFAMMSGQTLTQYTVPLPGGLQVAYNSAGLQYYRFVDWLGTSRLETASNGSLTVSRAYAPFGETYNGAGISASDRLFTGQTQDVSPGAQGIYDFLFRQYSSSQGRWLVPDPAGLAAVDPTNPQTWNRYAYVGNNPLNRVDPLGLDDSTTTCTNGHCTNVTNVDVTGYYPGGWWDLAFEGWTGTGSLQSFFCMVMGGCSGGGSSTGGGGGGSTSQPPPQPKPQPAPSNPVSKTPNPCLASQLNKDVRSAAIAGFISDALGGPGFGPALKVGFVYATERTNGIWDFKNQPYPGAHPELDDFGNFHYGAVGQAIGLPAPFMQWAAGVASWSNYRSKGVRDPYGNPFSGPPWGDNPENQYWIKQGQQLGSCQ